MDGFDKEKRDPKERDPRYRHIIKVAEQEAEEEVAREYGNKMFLGKCHMVWGIQKEILKNKYGIDWKDPAEMNPDIMFD
jgi:hypothetical protein